MQMAVLEREKAAAVAAAQQLGEQRAAAAAAAEAASQKAADLESKVRAAVCSAHERFAGALCLR